MRAKSHDIQWPVTPKIIEDINTNFDSIFDALNTFEKSVASSKDLHELLSVTHSDSIKANRLRGDLIVAQGAVPQWTRLAKGTLAHVLTMGANEPGWASPNHVLLSATHSDSTAAAAVRGDIIVAQGVAPVWTRLAKGTSGYGLVMGANEPAWTSLAHAILSANHNDSTAAAVVRGDLIAGIGGTPKWERLAKGTATHVLTMGADEPGWAVIPTQTSALLSAVHTDTTPAAVVRGDLIAGIGATPKWERVAAGTLAYVLTMGATEPGWAAIPTQTSALLSAVHTDTTPSAVARGDLIVGSTATPKWTALMKGTAGFVLTMGAEEPAWASPAAPAAHQLDGALHTVSGLTGGHFLKATGATTFAFAAHGLSYGDVGAAPANHSILSATHGDSTAAVVVRGDLVVGIGASPKWERLPKGTAGYFLKATVDDAVWAAHGLTYSDVGALAAGATAVDSDKLDGQHGSYYAVAGAAPAAHQLDGALHTVSGLTTGHFLKATGATTFAFGAHGLAYGDVGAAAASHVHAWADITSGVPTTWTPIAHDILSAYHGDTTAAAVVRGDLIIGSGATPKWTRLAIGTAGYVLKAGANEPAWGTLASTDLSDTANLVRLGAANSFTLINPLTTLAESWIGPSSTAGIYFKGGNVAFGTTTPIGAGVTVGGSAAGYWMAGAGAPADEKIWQTVAPGDGTYRIRAWNDALANYGDAFIMTRSGYGVTSFTLYGLTGIGTPSALRVLHLVRFGGDETKSGILFSDDTSGNYRSTIIPNFSGGTAANNKLQFLVCNATTTGQVTPLVLKGDGGVVMSLLGAFVASDKYVVVDASGNLHVSTLGPLA